MNWLLPEQDETPTLEEIKKAILIEATKQGNETLTDTVQIKKNESIIEVLARKAASDTLTDEEQEAMLKLFRSCLNIEDE